MKPLAVPKTLTTDAISSASIGSRGGQSDDPPTNFEKNGVANVIFDPLLGLTYLPRTSQE